MRLNMPSIYSEGMTVKQYTFIEAFKIGLGYALLVGLQTALIYYFYFIY